MIVLDSRRLTGPNLQSRAPLAIMEIGWSDGEDPSAALAAWRHEIARFVDDADLIVRRFDGGAVLCVHAPIDALLATTEMNEWALERATAIAAGHDPGPLEPRFGELLALRSSSLRPSLIALQREALARDLPFIWDDTEITVGMGGSSRTWNASSLPQASDVPWQALGRIPVALVTGTNGKTTSARLVARMVRCAGWVPGLASSGGITVDEVQVEVGDWTGPAAARVVLRRRDVEIAVLETARGGILRRGLAIDRCDAALITNISADHLGDYGVNDLATMARVKAVVGRSVRAGGKVVLGANSLELREATRACVADTVLFAADEDAPALVEHRARGGEVWFTRAVSAGASIASAAPYFMRARGGEDSALLPVLDAPITFAGHARFNVENALGAAALASALGIPDAAIAEALRSFQPSATDNPGRGNIHDVGGIQVLLDYAHNPDGLHAVLALVAHLRDAGPDGASRGDPAPRLFVVFGQPGDRGNAALAAAAAAVVGGNPDGVIVHEMAEHLRGRGAYEVPALLHQALIASGLASTAIEVAGDEAEALAIALAQAVPGDFVVVVPHVPSEAVSALLAIPSSR